MTYAQVLRLRNTLTIYGLVIGGVFLLMLLLSHAPGHSSFDSDDASDLHHAMGNAAFVPLSFLFFISGWCAIVIATVISSSLNREYDGVEMVWTKPIDRARLALEYILLDFAAIVVAFVAAAALCVLGVASVGLLTHIVVDPRTIPTLVIGLGTAFMWYGLVQGITAGMPGRGGMIIGLSWAAAFVLVTLAEATRGGSLIHSMHTLLTIVDLFNPIAYFSSYSLSGFGAHPSPVLPQMFAGTEARSIMTWALGLVGCVAAIAGWKRLEA
jgi:hypothetical protein